MGEGLGVGLDIANFTGGRGWTGVLESTEREACHPLNRAVIDARTGP